LNESYRHDVAAAMHLRLALASRPACLPKGTKVTCESNYTLETIKPILAVFWWLNKYLGGRTPSQFLLSDHSSNRAPDFDKMCAGPLEDLKAYVSKHQQNAHLDYQNEATFLLFDQAYFYRNFLKCLLAAHCIQDSFPDIQDTQTVVDVGCGVGTFAIACQLMHTFPRAQFVLSDQYELQCDLATKLFSALQLRSFTVRQANAFQQFGRRGLRIASYWLCGNRRGVVERSNDELRQVLRDGMILIDYERNIEDFSKRIDFLQPRLLPLKITAPVSPEVARFVGSRDLTVHVLGVDAAHSYPK